MPGYMHLSNGSKKHLEIFLVDCLLYHPEVIRRYFLPEPFAAFFLATRVVVSSTFMEEVKKKKWGTKLYPSCLFATPGGDKHTGRTHINAT